MAVLRCIRCSCQACLDDVFLALYRRDKARPRSCMLLVGQASWVAWQALSFLMPSWLTAKVKEKNFLFVGLTDGKILYWETDGQITERPSLKLAH